jgi:hypothetical protein
MASKGKLAAGRSPLLFRLVALQVGVAFLTTASIVANVHQDTPFVVASKGTFYDMFFDQNDITRKAGGCTAVEPCHLELLHLSFTCPSLPVTGRGQLASDP